MVSSELKYALLSRLSFQRLGEGWALIVTEENSVETPVVVYNVPGLRDWVKNGENWYLVEENLPSSLA